MDQQQPEQHQQPPSFPVAIAWQGSCSCSCQQQCHCQGSNMQQTCDAA
jgi:hypothetical protein